LTNNQGRKSPEIPKSSAIDSQAKVFPLHCMTVLLQTRVERQVGEKFKRAARRRGKSAYAYLQQIVQQAATQPVEPRTWKNHRQLVARLKLKPVPYNIVARTRDECDER
jgi:hypothetical protein